MYTDTSFHHILVSTRKLYFMKCCQFKTKNPSTKNIKKLDEKSVSSQKSEVCNFSRKPQTNTGTTRRNDIKHENKKKKPLLAFPPASFEHIECQYSCRARPARERGRIERRGHALCAARAKCLVTPSI